MRRFDKQGKYGVRSPSLFGLHMHSCTHWLSPRTSPPHWGSYTSALLVSQDRRHLVVTSCFNISIQILYKIAGRLFCSFKRSTAFRIQNCKLVECFMRNLGYFLDTSYLHCKRKVPHSCTNPYCSANSSKYCEKKPRKLNIFVEDNHSRRLHFIR